MELVAKQEGIQKEIDIAIQEQAPNLYNRQEHRFEFKEGILHYNNIKLLAGQKLIDIEVALGTSYIEVYKEDGYSVIRYKDIPLKIIVSNGVITYYKRYKKSISE